MTIHVPKPLAIALGVLLGGVLLMALRDEGPAMWRYAKFEGM
ncbi:MAG: hypothetical protein ACLGI5_14190 [Thermoleophilia bacterium]